jgi:hypothetical protein
MSDEIQPKISKHLIAEYSAGPSDSKIEQAKSLRSYLEEALGADYHVFLQGSYRNHTGTSDLNDVDVVALAKSVHSTKRDNVPATNPVSWDEIFARVERRLEAHWKFLALWERGDKCIHIDTDLPLDVVPAIYHWHHDIDPIHIYSFREADSRENYPRDHWEAGVEKNNDDHTKGLFKPTVRLFKRWACNAFSDPTVAPSFYIECAVHAVEDEALNPSVGYLPLSFAAVALKLATWESSFIWSVAGDKNILDSTEWDPAKFAQFQAGALEAGGLVLDAIGASTEAEANRLWRQAFDG